MGAEGAADGWEADDGREGKKLKRRDDLPPIGMKPDTYIYAQRFKVQHKVSSVKLYT